ncbi:hypothetical protein GCM10022207_02340 [Streptomyces lannensis]|uniref:Uncharacterized protein n=1 Tax=Streptomyces lannensis TaxID=766498 RepID=A0ABP7JHH6_9ACTN
MPTAGLPRTVTTSLPAARVAVTAGASPFRRPSPVVTRPPARRRPPAERVETASVPDREPAMVLPSGPRERGGNNVRPGWETPVRRVECGTSRPESGRPEL